MQVNNVNYYYIQLFSVENIGEISFACITQLRKCFENETFSTYYIVKQGASTNESACNKSECNFG